MDSQKMERKHGEYQTHHYEQDPHNVGLHSAMENEDENHPEKMSVMNKVKAKAKKIKDKLMLHGHGHEEGHVPDDHDLGEEEDDEEDQEEIVEDPEHHEGSGFDPVSDPIKDSVPDQLKVDVGRTGHIKEVPSAPLNTLASSEIFEQSTNTNPVRNFVHEQEANRDQPEIHRGGSMELEEESHAPKDRPEDYTAPNYQTKTADPTGAGGVEAGVSPILRSFDKMNINEQKPGEKENFPAGLHGTSAIFPTGTHDQFSPEPTPPKPINTQDIGTHQDQPGDAADNAADKPFYSNQGSYSEKISYATSVIADKAISAKNFVASKLGYGEKNVNQENETNGGGQDGAKTAVSPVKYGKKIASTVTEKLAPVYGKVAGAGSAVMSKVHGISPAGTDNKNGGSGGGRCQDKGVSVKDYFAEKLRPGDEDRALSEVISETLHKRKEEAEEEKPMGIVTESEEVKRHLGSTDDENAKGEHNSENVHGEGVVDKLKGSVGSWFGKGQEMQASEQSLGSSAGTQGFVTSTIEEKTGEKRLQESGN